MKLNLLHIFLNLVLHLKRLALALMLFCHHINSSFLILENTKYNSDEERSSKNAQQQRETGWATTSEERSESVAVAVGGDGKHCHSAARG